MGDVTVTAAVRVLAGRMSDPTTGEPVRDPGAEPETDPTGRPPENPSGSA